MKQQNLTIKIKTGQKANLNVAGKTLGELKFTTDTKELFIGDGTNNVRISASIIETTYAALKALRDTSKLVPGQQYRITDYVTTTAQSNTQSAEHPFDIIVTADSANKLSENARACLHAGDLYFIYDRVEAWRLKYRLDNDTVAFNWAYAPNLVPNLKIYPASAGYATRYVAPNTVFEIGTQLYYNPALTIPAELVTELSVEGYPIANVYGSDETFDTFVEQYEILQGTGVIYELVDAWGNRCGYDFKNIMTRKDGVYYYTFDSAGTDASVSYGAYNANCEKNVIEPKHFVGGGPDNYELNGIILRVNSVSSIRNNYFDFGCGDIFAVYDTTGTPENVENNVFGSYCKNISFKNGFISNRFGNRCVDLTFDVACIQNCFGHDCTNNTFGSSCGNMKIGNLFKDSTIGTDCTYLIAEGNNSTIVLGSGCSSITLQYAASYINFYSNTYHVIVGKNSAFLSTSTAHVRYLEVGPCLQGASTSNPLELYDAAIANKSYQSKITKAASGRYLMLWATDTGTMTGKYKATNVTATWTAL